MNKGNKLGIINFETGEVIGEFNEGDKIIRKGTIEQLSKYIMKWKSNKNIQFIKVYRKEKIRHMKNTDLTAHAKAFLFDMEIYIEYKTNLLISDKGKPMTNSDIQSITKMDNKTIARVLKELEEKLYIKIVGRNKGRKIYFNPYLYCAGTIIERDVVLLFEDYRAKYSIDINQYLS